MPPVLHSSIIYNCSFQSMRNYSCMNKEFQFKPKNGENALAYLQKSHGKTFWKNSLLSPWKKEYM